MSEEVDDRIQKEKDGNNKPVKTETKENKTK